MASAAPAHATNVVGMHFFNPADRNTLIEVIYGQETSGNAVATVFDVTKRMKKTPVLVGNCPGFVGNRMGLNYMGEACRLPEQFLCHPEEIDQVFRDFGFVLGPAQMTDMIGLDTMDRVCSQNNWPTPAMVKQLCALGRFGRKSGRGFYIYDPVIRRRKSDPEVKEMAQKLGMDKQQLSKEEILYHCLAPLVKEGQKILDEKIAVRASDIDLIWIYGFGWPMSTGGPMRWFQEQLREPQFAKYFDSKL